MKELRALSSGLKLVLELGKIRISQMVTLSTATGFVLAGGALSWEVLPPVLGIFLLALGSGALNQIQEREKDALMPRTRNRPLPSGRVSLPAALSISFGLLLAGGLVLYFGSNPTALGLGLLTALWYNGVYTYLKRVTPLAVIPGALIGSLPPLVGWAAAGGNVLAPPALLIALIFFIWQIPHFWLLLLNFGCDYESAGMPTLTAVFSENQLGRLSFIWIAATAASILLLPLFGIGNSAGIYALLTLTSMALVGNSIRLLRPRLSGQVVRMAFHGINIFILAVMVLLSLDRLM